MLRRLPLAPLLLFAGLLASSAERRLAPAAPRLAAAPLDAPALGLRQLTADAPRFVAAWSLRSDDPRFGGLSAMTGDDDGLLALTDKSIALRLMLADGRPAKLRFLGRIAGPGLRRGPGPSDAESLARCAPGGDFWVGFESRHRVWRYDARLRPRARARPAFARRWPKNGGLEAIACLPNGRFLLFREQSPGPDGAGELWLSSGDPTAPAARFARLNHYGPPGHRPTDALAWGPDRLLILHRRFGPRGFSAVLSALDLSTLARGTLAHRPLLELRAPWPTDNWEALALTRENGRDLLWIAADDNFMPGFRTVLLKLALPARAS